MTSTRGSRTRVIVAAGTSVLMAGLTLGATAGTAEAEDAAPAARKATTTSMSFSGSKVVTTSKGKRLLVTVNGSKSPGSKPYVSGGFSTKDSGESHVWSFKTSNKNFSQSKRLTGKVKISKGATKRYLGLSLKVKPAGKIKADKCQGQVSMKMRKVVLVGKLYVNTKAKWGKLNKRGFRVPGVAYRYFDANCSYSSSCSNFVSWSINKGSKAMYGSQTKKRASVSGYNSAKINKNGTRYDSFFDSTVKRAKLMDAKNKMVVFSDGGKGTLRADAPQYGNYKCKPKKTQFYKSWYGKLKNGKTPLRVKAQIYKSIKFKNGTQAYFNKYNAVKTGKQVVLGKDIVDSSRKLG